jgi:hypothetical protein
LRQEIETSARRRQGQRLEDYLTTEAETKRMVSVCGTKACVTVVENQRCRVRIVRKDFRAKQGLEKSLSEFYFQLPQLLLLQIISADSLFYS